MEINNDLPDIDIQKPINSSQLSYQENSEEDTSVSKAANTKFSEKRQCVSHEAPALKTRHKPQSEDISNNNSNGILQETLNIQLPYNINQAMNQDIWDGDF